MSQLSLTSVTVTNGSQTVAFQAGTDLSTVVAGNIVIIDSETTHYYVATVNDGADTLTLTGNYTGGTRSTASAIIHNSFTVDNIPYPEAGDTRNISIIKAAINKIQDVLNTKSTQTLDYATGSWTPYLFNSPVTGREATYTTQVGRYTRIGEQVFISGYIEMATKGTLLAGDSLTIISVPFSPNSSYAGASRTSFNFGLVTGASITAGQVITGHVDENLTDGDIILKLWDSTGGVSDLTAADLGSTAVLQFSGSYYT